MRFPLIENLGITLPAKCLYSKFLLHSNALSFCSFTGSIWFNHRFNITAYGPDKPWKLPLQKTEYSL